MSVFGFGLDRKESSDTTKQLQEVNKKLDQSPAKIKISEFQGNIADSNTMDDFFLFLDSNKGKIVQIDVTFCSARENSKELEVYNGYHVSKFQNHSGHMSNRTQKVNYNFPSFYYNKWGECNNIDSTAYFIDEYALIPDKCGWGFGFSDCVISYVDPAVVKIQSQ